MSKRVRQYIGLFAAIVAYYVVHEGAHLIYALCIGGFKQINFIGLGVQIDVYAEQMTSQQMGVFCILGSVATTITAYVLVVLADRINNIPSKVFKASMYYITIIMLLMDPLYLSLLVVNVIVFFKLVLPKYKAGVQEEALENIREGSIAWQLVKEVL